MEIVLNGGKGVENYGMMNFLVNFDIIDYLKKLFEFRVKLFFFWKGSFIFVFE